MDRFNIMISLVTIDISNGKLRNMNKKQRIKLYEEIKKDILNGKYGKVSYEITNKEYCAEHKLIVGNYKPIIRHIKQGLD